MRRIAMALGLVVAAPALAGDGADLVERWDKAPTVSGVFQDRPVDAVLGEICKAAGCRPIRAVQASRKISLDLKDTPFLEALDRVAEKAGWVLVGSAYGGAARGSFAPDDELRFALPEPDLVRVAPCYSGPARVSLVSVAADRPRALVRFSPDAEPIAASEEKLVVRIRCALIDGLGDVECGGVSVETALEGDGRRLTTKSDKQESIGPRPRRLAGEHTLELPGAGGWGGSIATLSGNIVALLPRAAEVAEIDLATLPATTKIGGATIRVESVSDTVMVVEIRGLALPGMKKGMFEISGISVQGKEPPDPGSMFAPGLGDVVLVVRDAAGAILESSGYGGGGGGDSMKYTFSMGGRAARITAKAVTQVERREIPFRFAGVPLPR